MTVLEVNDSCCGFRTSVRVERISKDRVSVHLENGCPMVLSCGPLLAELRWARALNPQTAEWLYEVMFTRIRHCGCLVPSAVARAIEVEVGASLAKKASIESIDPMP